MKRIFSGYLMIMQQITFQLIETSIVGVTYMDNFDFEDRYTDMNECNPYYWHPLHLPEECLDVFEKFIRTGLRSSIPYNIVRDKQDYPVDYPSSPEDLNEPFYGTSPFQTLFELLRRDINDLPRAPSMAVSPHFGRMALYRQPVSYKSAVMIEKLARAYGSSDTPVWPRPRVYDYDSFKKDEKKQKIQQKNKKNK